LAKTEPKQGFIQSLGYFTGNRPRDFLLGGACLIVLIAGMRAASALLVPFMLSIFIAVIAAPLLFWLQERGLPKFFAMAIVFFGIILTLGLFVTLIGASIQDFSLKLPEDTDRLRIELRDLFEWLEANGVASPEEDFINQLTPESGVRVFTVIVAGFGTVITNAFIVLVIVFFILLEAAALPGKLRAAAAGDAKWMDRTEQVVRAVRRYMVLKTVVSVATGLLVTAALMIIGVDYPWMWGTVAFLFNFVPNVGSILAAIPAVLLAVLQLGFLPGLYTAAAYLGINILIGNFLEPRFMGHRFGLSPLVVLLSLVFWAWVLGPIGMLLSVPITIALSIGFSANPNTRALAILLADESTAFPESTKPAET